MYKQVSPPHIELSKKGRKKTKKSLRMSKFIPNKPKMSKFIPNKPKMSKFIPNKSGVPPEL